MAKNGAPPRRTQAQRREQAESALLDAAVNLIATKGLDGFTLNEVGEAAGYSRGLPVHYFGTKDRLLGLVAEHLVGTYVQARDSDASSPPGLPRLLRTIHDYCTMPMSSRTLALRILMANAAVHPALTPVAKGLNASGLKWIQDEIKAGIVAGNVRKTADTAVAATMVYSFMRGLRGFQPLVQGLDPAAVAAEFNAALSAHLSPVPPATRKPAARAATPSRSLSKRKTPVR